MLNNIDVNKKTHNDDVRHLNINITQLFRKGIFEREFNIAFYYFSFSKLSDYSFENAHFPFAFACCVIAIFSVRLK